MIVVADTSPLNYLIQLKLDCLLEQLYKELVVPTAVIDELRASGAPSSVRDWAIHAPPWIQVRVSIPRAEPELTPLDAGERAAIELALQLRATTVLIDERRGRLVAQKFGLAVTGTLGVLRDAHLALLVDATEAYAALCTKNSFHHDQQTETIFFRSLRA